MTVERRKQKRRDTHGFRDRNTDEGEREQKATSSSVFDSGTLDETERKRGEKGRTGKSSRAHIDSLIFQSSEESLKVHRTSSVVTR
jgi:hypothetical protein